MKQHFTKLFFAAFLPLAAYGQTIVNTMPENKKVILEEFTGVNCVYCPQGHAIAKQIQDNNPGNVFLINIHQGNFATPQGGQPDFRTTFGNAIANQTGLTGYPAGTVNRHVFPGLQMGAAGTTAMGRGEWTNAANQILTQNSYVNVALESEIDSQTRQMTITAEVYYTGNSPVNTNKLNIVLLQNNTLGPQTGGNQGSNYNHMHRLVHMITGQWGDDITTTTTGSFVTKTYTYTIPESHNNIPIVFGDLELVAFVAEGNQEIISGNGTLPAYTNLPYANDASINAVTEIDPQCSGTVTPKIQILNNGSNALTTLDITYTMNSGTPQTYTWTGNLGGLQYETVELPAIAYDQQSNVIAISLPSDENGDNNTANIEFESAVETTTTLSLELRTDQYASETRWNIKRSNGATVQQGQGYANNQTYNIDITLPADDCYTFNLIDTYGDGGARVTLKDSAGTQIYNTTGNYGSGASANFAADGSMAVTEADLANLRVFPNPSTGIINVELSKNAQIQIYDVTGRSVYTGNAVQGKNTIDLTGKGKGVFVVKITEGKNVSTSKVVIK